MNNKTPKEKLNKRTKFTIVSIVNIIWYTIVVLVASFFNHSVPSELTIAWFSAWTVELALLYGIKIKSKDNNYDYQDNCQARYNDPMYDSICNDTNVQSEDSVEDYCDDVG